jgi:signal transduction histidine kinase
MFPAVLPRRLIRPAVWTTAAVTLGLTVTATFVPITVVARLVAPSYLVFIPAIVCICWTFVKVFIKGQIFERITAVGIAVLFVTLFIEMLLQRAVPEITRSGLAPFGMLTFTICQMLALGLENTTLARLNHMKDEFLQDLRHELQNPLTVISTGVESADVNIASGGDVSKTRKALEIVQDETLRLGRMVRGMIRLAEMTEEKESRKRADFAVLLKNSAEAFRPVLEKQNNKLSVNITPELPDVFVEVDKFKQVMTNLFSNVARHTHGGHITITAERDGAFNRVCLTDTGEGFDPEILRKVFERGVSGGDGTGYGLYLCKTVIEAHGGVIGIESEPGEGTAVTFTVPVYGGQDGGVSHE